ncbi:MAG: TIGR03790 family protein [Verrucomicrobia bacterium]|nr:TIGR03790 family protein [Verrucomicrobiota bacterium]
MTFSPADFAELRRFFSAKISVIVTGLLLAAAPLFAANAGDEVVVVFNSRLPESKAVAEHYAEVRHVPTNQVFGFNLSTNESISRQEFHDTLQKPLAKTLEKEKLWHVGSEVSTGTNGAGRVVWKVLNSKIRYAVLCYGVPLHITEDPALVEPGTDKMRPEMRRNEAAVDSELACLPVLEQHPLAAGPLRNPYYTTTNAALLHPTNNLLIVARLDGPTAEIARSLVDKAILAETDGLWGRAYFDTRNISDIAYKTGDEWIRGAAEIARFTGFETVTDTNAATFPAAFPMSHVAIYAGWYDENVSGPFARTNIEFMPGAFAYHLHSFSAETLRSTKRRWCGPLLAEGATCTMGCVAEPYLEGTPDIGIFFGRFCIYGFTFGEAACAAQSALSWQTAVVGDPLYRPFGKNPQAQHLDLEHRHRPQVEWSHLKVINLNLTRHTPLAQAADYLKQIPLTKQSAVLAEKLADVYAALGKPASAIRSYQSALKLNPSPQQRLRLRLTLGEKLTEQDRADEAVENYRQLLAENPDYPDRASIEAKLAPPPVTTNVPAK